MKRMNGHVKRVLKFLLLIILSVGTFAFAMFQGGFVSWFLFGSFFPISLYNMILFFYPIRNFTVEREFNQSEYNAGEKAVMTIRITRKDWFPLFFLIIEDMVPIKLKQRTGQNFKFVLYPFFKRELTYIYEIQKIPRGEYSFEQLKLKTSDLLTLMDKEAYFSNRRNILVYPSYVDMVYQPFENQFEQGMTASRFKVQRDTTMAISIREYEPGDRFSWIHWKASARKNDIMTKEFEQRQTHDVLLVLDRTPNEQFDLAVTFTASVIRAVLNKGAEVGLFSYGERKDHFPIQRGDFQLRTLFYHLASVEDNAEIEFGKVLESEYMNLQRNQVAMFIVNEIRPDDINAFNIISSKKGETVIFVVKPQGFKVSNQELALFEETRRRGIITKVVYEGEFAGVFGRGDW